MKEVFVDSTKCVSCHSCEMACVIAHSKSKNLFGAIGEKHPQRARIYVVPTSKGSFPLQCRHCTEPLCVSVCISGALYIDEKSGAVLLNEQRCIGCSFCVHACPVGLIERQEASEDSCAVSKCDLCASLGAKESGVVRAFAPGSPQPACITACPTGALSFEAADTYSTDKRRAYLVEHMTYINA